MPVSSQRGSGGASRLGQEGRYTRLHAPGGEDKLVMHRFAGTEALSRLFEFQVDALSEDADYKLEELLGRSVGVSFWTYGGVERFFNGIVASGEWTGKSQGLYGYRLVLRPWFWLLGRKTNCKIFKNKTIVEIIKKVFDDSGFADYEIKLYDEFKKQEFIVQYGETDLAFVCRLMEEWGIYFYFEHTLDKHVMHLIDNRAMHPGIDIAGVGNGEPIIGQLPFRPLEERSRLDVQALTAWRAERQVRTGRVELRDFDYLAPHTSMKEERSGEESYRHSSIEAYDYRGRWTTHDKEGERLAKIRLEAEQALDHRRFGMGNAASLYPGGKFNLVGHEKDDGQYLVVAARHRFTSQDYRSGGGGDERPYEGSYEFQPQARVFRAPLATPRPRIFGPQTAFVVGRPGRESEEIDVDEHGRIVVNFHWNRGRPNDDCSRDVRVAQSWAGKGWGFQFIPRVGMEVVVEFLDGDPDQPLVTGAVYNGDFKYPYEMPKHKTQSGIKTRSTQHGRPDNFNELRFEDNKGQEEVYFRAEKDHNSLIQNIETRTILNHLKTEIGKNFDGTGGGKHNGPSRGTTIHNGTDMLEITDGDRVVEIDKGNDDLTLDLGNKSTLLKQGDLSMTLKAGDWLTEVTGAVQIVATNSITLQIKGGQTSIVLDPTGITLKGPMININ